MKKHSFGKILFLGILFLSAPVFISHMNADQKKEVDDDPSLKYFLNSQSWGSWRTLNTSPQAHGPRDNKDDLESFQALGYLQGYNPPVKLSNVTAYDPKKSSKGYNLFLSAHAPEAILMDMNGNSIHQWQYSSASLPIPREYAAGYWHRARILKNGDLLALIPFNGIIKIDKKSNLIWFKKMFCHHDFDMDEQGNIYTLTVKNAKFGDDSSMKINSISMLSPRGQLIREISLYDLFKKYPNPFFLHEIDRYYGDDLKIWGMLKNRQDEKIPYIPGDVFHANTIQVLDGKWGKKIPAFKKGNLLVSVRRLGVLICVDPYKEEIEWAMDSVFWKKGQHFAKLLDNGNILIFDNYYRPNASRVVEFDPVSQKIVWDYSNENGPFFSDLLGLCYRLPNGNTLITESTNGHSFEVTPDKKIVWEFYNPHQIERSSMKDGERLIAMIYQMERIPSGPSLEWLNN